MGEEIARLRKMQTWELVPRRAPHFRVFGCFRTARARLAGSVSTARPPAVCGDCASPRESASIPVSCQRFST